VPQSANSLEIALALYDAIRPFSMVVEDTTIDDFRWCGIPASLDVGDNPVTAHASRVRTTATSSAGTSSPASPRSRCAPTTARIFLSETCGRCCPTGRSTSCRPGLDAHWTTTIVERWHDSLQAAYQSFRNGAGFKGRAVHERGRFVGWVGFEPLGSWRELQQHLHRHIAVAITATGTAA
jgi:putative transposase